MGVPKGHIGYRNLALLSRGEVGFRHFDRLVGKRRAADRRQVALIDVQSFFHPEIVRDLLEGPPLACFRPLAVR